MKRNRGWASISGRVAATAVLYIGLVILLTSLLLSQSVAAKDPSGLQVTPLRAYPAQDPGTTTHGSLTLTNYTTTTQQVILSVETFRTVDENYRYSFGSSQATTWVQFDQPIVTLAPRQSQAANYTIAVPANASPGGKYLALISSISGVSSSQNINEIHRVASLVYLQVNGAVSKTGQFLSFDTPRLTSKPVFGSIVRLANSGNTHYQARVGFTVSYWPFHNYAQDGQVQAYILPGTVRQIENKLYTPSLPGVYRLTADFTAPQGNTTKLTQLVIFMPWWFVVMVGLCLFVGSILSFRYWHTRHYRRRARRLKKAQKTHKHIDINRSAD